MKKEDVNVLSRKTDVKDSNLEVEHAEARDSSGLKDQEKECNDIRRLKYTTSRTVERDGGKVRNKYTDLKGTSIDGDDLSVYRHKLFPQRYKFGRPSCKVHNKNGVKSDFTGSQTGKSLNVVLPRISIDNRSLSTNQKQRTCPFVDNHRTYLKQRGYKLDVLYSLKGTRKVSNNDVNRRKDFHEQTKLDLDTFIQAERQKEVFSPREITANGCYFVDRRNKSIYNPLIMRMLRGLEKEYEIPGHIRSEDTKSSLLGKVLSPRQVKDLLSQQEPVIPLAFYNANNNNNTI